MRYLVISLMSMALVAPLPAEAVFGLFRSAGGCNRGNLVNVNAGRAVNVAVNKNKNKNQKKNNNNNNNNNNNRQRNLADDRDGELIDRLNEAAILQQSILPVANPQILPQAATIQPIPAAQPEVKLDPKPAEDIAKMEALLAQLQKEKADLTQQVAALKTPPKAWTPPAEPKQPVVEKPAAPSTSQDKYEFSVEEI